MHRIISKIKNIRNNSRIIGKFPKIKVANIVHKVWDTDEEVDSVLSIDRVSAVIVTVSVMARA